MSEKTLDPPRQDGRNDARIWAPEPREQQRDLAARASGDRELWARIRDVLESDQGHLIPYTEVAQACDLTPAEAREEVAAMAVAWSDGDRHKPLNHGALRPFAQLHGARYDFYSDVFNSLVYPSAYRVEELVDQANYAELDAALAEVAMPSANLPDGAPALQWRNGEPLSTPAANWYHRHLLSETHYYQRGMQPQEARHKPVRGAAELVTPSLSDESLAEFSRWIVRQRLPDELQASIPEGSKLAVDALGELKSSGRLRRALVSVRGVTQTDQFELWLARWGLPHRPAVVEENWPSEDNPTGSAEFWAEMAAYTLERALAHRRSFAYRHLRNCYLWHPVARQAIEGVVFHTEKSRLVWAHDGKLFDADGQVRLEPDAELVVAHPAAVEDWPDIPTQPSFAQRKRPVFGLDDLPEIPDKPIDHDVWKERARKLMLYGLLDEEYGDGRRSPRSAHTTYAWWAMQDRQLYVKHNGYGHGYGGPERSVQIQGFRFGQNEHDGPQLSGDKTWGWDNLDPGTLSECILLMRQILGQDPLPAIPDGVGLPETDDGGATASTGSGEVAKGERVRFTKGKNAGVEGRVFWFGDSKFGPGKRVGVNGDDGETYWADADDVELV